MAKLHIPASRIAASLAILGVTPFVALALALWGVAPGWKPAFAQALLAYGALGLSFLGGIHWGAAMRDGEGPEQACRYAYGLMPVLLGWVVLMCPPANGFFLLFWGLVAAFLIDRRVWQEAQWFIILRAVLTIIACASLFAAYKAL